MENKQSNDMPYELQSLCWNITEKCNENCKFCYRKQCADNTLKENIQIANNLSQINLKKISFCGGEPLLYKNLFPLVKYVRKKNPCIKLSITTNGKCIDNELLIEIIKYFDWISLPMDSTKPVINEFIGRGKNHLEQVENLLQKCQNDINIKINTVVNKLNKEELINIYHILSQYQVKRWKIFRFFPIREAKKYRDMFYISQSESEEIALFLQELNEKSNCNIEYNDFERQPSCLSIYPDGTIENSDNEIIGNVLEDPIQNILKIKRLEFNKDYKK